MSKITWTVEEIVLFFAIWVFVGSWCNARLKVSSLLAFIEPKYIFQVNEHKTHQKCQNIVELGSKEMISKDLLVYWVYWLLWTHQKCRHIVEEESKERISTVSPLIPSPPIWPTNWPSTTCGQSLKVSLQLKRQSYWDQIHGVTRPERGWLLSHTP